MRKIYRLFTFIRLAWLFKLEWNLFFTKKIKVGFGPVTTGENDFAERKWRIDPIIDEINRKSDRYAAGLFVTARGMKKYDRIIIVKKFAESIPLIESLKKEKKLFIYDIVDNPNCDKKYGNYLEAPGFTHLMDGFILSSPLQKIPSDKPRLLIEHPVINQSYKKDHSSKEEITLLAQGYYENLKILKWIEPLLPEISREIGKKVVLVYHSEVVLPNTEWVRYVKWSVKNCFPIMNSADMAVTIKELNKVHQRTKPSTKVIAYMAAALPVICVPTVADRLVIQHGVTGFFAYTKDDWKRWIKTLAKSPRLRSQIGRAARASVIDRYSISSITDKYIQLLDQL